VVGGALLVLWKDILGIRSYRDGPEPDRDNPVNFLLNKILGSRKKKINDDANTRKNQAS
jgi:hypothetical protein